jgi:hypothetical protein
MVLPERIRDKIHLMEEVINFPTSLISHRGYHWENLPMVSYSNLAGVVLSLVERGKKAVIVTGFYIPAGKPPATETDGPPGTLILAEGLKFMGMEVCLISDEYTLPTLKAGLDVMGLSEKELPLICFPMEHSDPDHANRADNDESHSPVSLAFVQDFFKGPFGKDLTHLIYLERVGPNHTLESLSHQERKGAPPLNDFDLMLPPSMRNRCLNSRLEDITRFTGKTHFFLEIQRKLQLPIESIGIGDRGNEIGAGRIPWEIFRKKSSDDRGAIFCSRMKTDHFVSCGISNWGGYALMAGVALAKGRLDILEKVTPEQEKKVLDYLIHHGPAVDGMTFRQESSVDGIEFDDYMRVIDRVKEIALE